MLLIIKIFLIVSYIFIVLFLKLNLFNQVLLRELFMDGWKGIKAFIFEVFLSIIWPISLIILIISSKIY